MTKYEFWKDWKRKTKLEYEAIKSIKSAKRIILENISHNEIAAIYVKGSVIRREMNKKKPVDLAHRIHMISLSILDVPGTYLPNYPQELSQNKYELMKDLGQGIEGLIIVDIIGQDHLEKTVKRGSDRDVLCITRKGFQSTHYPRITLIKGNYETFSSSWIRKQIRQREFQDLQIDSRVLTYILENQLYQ